MRITLPISIILLLSAAVIPGSAVEISYSDATGSLTLDAQMASHNLATGQFEASGDVRIAIDGSTMEADTISGNLVTRELSAFHAKGQLDSLRFWGDITTRRIPAARAPGGYKLEYKIKNGEATTCDLPKPDYRITAREITVAPNGRTTARKVSLFLGRSRVFTAPFLRTTVRPNRKPETLLPKPGYDSRDGAFLGIDYTIADSVSTNAKLDLRATSRRGFQGGLLFRRLISGKAMTAESPAELDLSARPILLPDVAPVGKTASASAQSDSPSSGLTGYAKLARHERVYDVNNRGLLLDSLPEVGLRWTSPRFHPVSGHKFLGYVVADASWGEFREVDGSEDKRTDLRLILSTLPVPVTSRMYVQPALLLRKSTYRSGDSFSSRGVSLDVTQTIGQSYISARYLSHSSSGTTPFEFDNIDYPRQLQGALGCRWKRNTVNVILRYDLGGHDLYDWEVSYSRKLHCLEPTFTWHNRFGLFAIDVKLIDLG